MTNDTEERTAIRLAELQRDGILNQRAREGRTGPHPYGALDFTREEDRRIIAAVYASMVPRN